MKRWTSAEIAYMREHGREGAQAVADALGRSVASVSVQASRYGITLRRRWLCTNCGEWTYKPLDGRTGWCATCAKARGRQRIERDIEQIRAELAREAEETRARQAAYAKKSRLRKTERKLKDCRSGRENRGD